MKGFFGDLFDFDGDGQLDGSERAADFTTFAQIMDNIGTEEQKASLKLSGSDTGASTLMDPGKRRKMTEEAGLDRTRRSLLCLLKKLNQ